MFGYVKPDDPYLYKKDDVLYRAMYCGLCKSIGATCGQMARFSLTYDVAFLSVFAHNLLGCDVTIKKSHCVIHPITKRPIAKRDGISDDLAAVNVILARHKVNDDRFDSKRGFFKGMLFRRGYKKAKKRLPEIDEIVSLRYKQLLALENADNGVIDQVSEVFSLMLAEISDRVFKEKATINTYKVFFYLGKWIYIIDALDDYDKDVKKGEYNPLIKRFNAKNLAQLLSDNGQDIDFMLNDIFINISENLQQIKFHFNGDLVKNILLRGLPSRTKQVIEHHLKQGKKHVK